MEHWTFKQHLLPPGEPISGKTYRADGWAYVDPPARFSPERWDELLAIFGDGNYVFLAVSRGVDRAGGEWIRGQLLVSPEGWRRLEAKATPPRTEGDA